MRILFADDHDLLRDALKAYLEADEEFTVELASTVDEALVGIAHEGPFDLVLLDYQIPGMDGLLGLRRIVAAQDPRPVMLLTGVATDGTAAAALRSGAVAVLSKTMSVEKLKVAIVSVINGSFVPPYSGSAGQAGNADTPTLTPRQEQVLRCICSGLSNKQIARDLKLTEATIKMHVKMIFAKLGVNSRTQAILIARNFNLI
ncbi:response regulator [Porphyrobacter sp. AAP82]|uniref:response regulator transcription factor n=1 Tax=Porphyrobacter sp. AAP82 TaxID=1248917 RepID=UPI00036713D4|nr:response regulator transcription factor [Porphyrobacter sp. AAP82]